MLDLGCAPSIHVRTAEAPDANLSGSTYRLLPPGNAAAASANIDEGTAKANTAGGDVSTSANPAGAANPLLENPIALRHMRHAIEHDFAARGYHRETGRAALSVAYYLGVRHKLQVINYAYDYPF